MAAARKGVIGAKGGKVNVPTATGRSSTSAAQGRLLQRRMRGRG